MQPLLTITVAYADPESQLEIACELPPGATVQEAIERSGILVEYPSIDLNVLSVGIYSKKVSLQDRINNNDRVEIYRLLQVDPKEARRLRAAAKVKKHDKKA